MRLTSKGPDLPIKWGKRGDYNHTTWPTAHTVPQAQDKRGGGA